MKKDLESKLEEVEVPEGRELLWIIFWDLFSGERCSYTEIYSYLHLTNLTLTEYEIELLRAMDNVACDRAYKIRYPKKDKATPAGKKNK